MKALLRHAERVVREASEYARGNFNKDIVTSEKGNGDLVTSIDLEVEKYILKELAERYHDHGFDSEEKGQQHAEAEYVWVLDPIDGTKYYAKGNPLYSISLALRHRGKFVLGVVYCPEFEQMYCAYAGGGATLNGQPIHCSQEKDLGQATLCLEIPSKDSPSEELSWALDKMRVFIDNTLRVRILGVGSIGLCLSAMGGFDAWVSLASSWKSYDLAAGQVIMQEAGAPT